MTLERMATVKTPVGDSLWLAKMHGRAQLGRPFHYDLEVLSEDAQITAAQLLGQAISITLEQQKEHERHFHGIVTRFEQGRGRGRYAAYELTIRPSVWLLSRTTDCRIFPQATVPDVIQEVLRDNGVFELEFGLLDEYPTIDYQVQYRETSLQFITRLMERAGIYYYFKHTEQEHTMVFTDARHESATNYAEVTYYPFVQGQGRETEHIYRWSVRDHLQPGAYALNAFDFEKPKAGLAVRAIEPRDHPSSELEIYDYPGDYSVVKHGEAASRVLLEALQAQHHVVRAEADARGLTSGALFSLKGHPLDSQNKEYLITSEELALEDNAYESGEAATSSFRCTIHAIDKKTQFRLPLETPAPIIHGPQTAIVVGPKGQEIWTDAYGRVKVQFHWDRLGKSDGVNSCWVRVAQVWAGARWGAMHIPRIGQEVIVEFLEGNPDKPIITGRVYNADQLPPYKLPDNQTQSGIKSRSTKKGSPDNFNELRFEDKKGEEQIYLHAERDLQEIVENDHSTSVGANQTNAVTKNHSETVGGDQSLHVTGNRTSHIEGSQSVSIDGKTPADGLSGGKLGVTGQYKVDATQQIHVQSPVSIKLECGGSSILIEPNVITITAGGLGSLKLDVAALLKSSQGSELKLDANALAKSVAGAELLLDANVKNESSAGSKVVLDANVLAQSTGGAKLTLDTNALMSGMESKVSGNTTAQLDAGGNVKADPSGVTVFGTKVSIN